MAKKGQDPQGRDQDDVAFAPYTTVQKKILGRDRVQIAFVSAISQDATYTAQSQITDLLRQRHKLTANEPNDFTVRNMGLKETEHVSAIAINPQNPDIVYIGALGHAFGPNEERGVFMTTDGGKTWIKTLYIDNEHGVADLEIDPTNPNILYAGMDGFTATKLIRQNEQLKNVPIIAVTAHQEDDFRSDAKASGFDAYVTKPIDVNWLKELIAGLLI